MMFVTVLIITHRHGTAVSVHATEAGALAELTSYVDDWWEEELGPTPRPDDDAQAVSQYFAADPPGESYELFEAEVQP